MNAAEAMSVMHRTVRAWMVGCVAKAEPRDGPPARAVNVRATGTFQPARDKPDRRNQEHNATAKEACCLRD